MRYQQSRDSRRGALLLEVLVAALIFSVVVTAAAATAAYHERALQLHQDRNSATFLAEQQMEEILAQGFARLPQVAGTYPQDLVITRSVDGQPVKSTYRCTVSVEDSPEGDVRTVALDVGYLEREGPRKVHLETDVFWSR